jgi:hypothetical protein
MRPLFLGVNFLVMLFLMLMAFRGMGGANGAISTGLDVTGAQAPYTQQYRIGWPGNGTFVIGRGVIVGTNASRLVTLVPLSDATPQDIPATRYGLGAMSTPYATWLCMPAFVPPTLLNVFLLLLPWKKREKHAKTKNYIPISQGV